MTTRATTYRRREALDATFQARVDAVLAGDGQAMLEAHQEYDAARACSCGTGPFPNTCANHPTPAPPFALVLS